MSSFPPPPPSGYSDGGDPGWGPPPSDPYGSGAPVFAPWGARVGATIIDSLLGIPIFLGAVALSLIFGLVSEALGTVVLILGYLAAIGFGFWNLVRQGRTGQTIGKKTVGIALVRLGQAGPPGVGLSIGRSFLHIVDALPCYLGFLWPLWDSQRQTFADKILDTVVVKA
ncbi:MAG: RDD family protein [Acidimicrobiales bacterium]